MELRAFWLGIGFVVGSVILLIMERTTPKNERVLVKPWVTYSHESVQFSIILKAAMGFILNMIGLFL